MIYILKQRAQLFLVWNNAPPNIRKPQHNRQLSPVCANVLYFLNFRTLRGKSFHIDAIFVVKSFWGLSLVHLPWILATYISISETARFSLFISII
jgi:hypothetical protein